MRKRAYPFAQSPTNLDKFAIAVPGLGRDGQNELGQYIPVATPDTHKYSSVDYYNIAMQQYEERMHPKLQPTKLWGYADVTNQDWFGGNANHYLGPQIQAKSGRPVRITYTNNLPDKHILPVDNTIMGSEKGQAENRTVPHLHGALVQWTSDGGPTSWFTPSGRGFTHGPNYQPGDYLYPNKQSARMLWYHDHTLGNTRINVYGGLASTYRIADDAEASLVATRVIPDEEMPLVIQDKTFVTSDILAKDPKWKWGDTGDLWYPHVYESAQDANGDLAKGRWDNGRFVDPKAFAPKPLPEVSNVPEGFLDTIVINGAVNPYLEVKPKRYRFRILNASNARFYHLQLYVADSTGKEADLGKAGPAFIQIGNEGGFLPAPVVLNKPPIQLPVAADGTADFTKPFNLLLGPAERADIIIDFRGFQGAKLILYSDAPAPFPGGDDRNDYYTGNADQTAFGGAPSTKPGFGPNTRTLMQFRVANGSGSSEPDFNASLALLKAALPSVFAETQPQPFFNHVGFFMPGHGKTLNEDFDEYGRLWQRLGTTGSHSLNSQGMDTWGLDYVTMASDRGNITEIAQQGETQIWNVFNNTGDVHPVHFHLVNVQVISRAPFTYTNKQFQPDTRNVRPPDPNERGWKETVRMNPGEVTTIVMKFNAPAPRVYQPWVQFDRSPVTGGYEYMWHCHILDHEEHDMMRNLVVIP